MNILSRHNSLLIAATLTSIALQIRADYYAMAIPGQGFTPVYGHLQTEVQKALTGQGSPFKPGNGNFLSTDMMPNTPYEPHISLLEFDDSIGEATIKTIAANTSQLHVPGRFHIKEIQVLPSIQQGKRNVLYIVAKTEGRNQDRSINFYTLSEQLKNLSGIQAEHSFLSHITLARISGKKSDDLTKLAPTIQAFLQKNIGFDSDATYAIASIEMARPFDLTTGTPVKQPLATLWATGTQAPKTRIPVHTTATVKPTVYTTTTTPTVSKPAEEAFDPELKQAIRLSLREATTVTTKPTTKPTVYTTTTKAPAAHTTVPKRMEQGRFDELNDEILSIKENLENAIAKNKIELIFTLQDRVEELEKTVKGYPALQEKIDTLKVEIESAIEFIYPN